jgi:hypothetical protein
MPHACWLRSPTRHRRGWRSCRPAPVADGRRGRRARGAASTPRITSSLATSTPPVAIAPIASSSLPGRPSLRTKSTSSSAQEHRQFHTPPVLSGAALRAPSLPGDPGSAQGDRTARGRHRDDLGRVARSSPLDRTVGYLTSICRRCWPAVRFGTRRCSTPSFRLASTCSSSTSSGSTTS